jgi:LysM repeat protein
VAFLLAATLAVVLLRVLLHDDGSAATKQTPAAHTTRPAAPRFYRVRAGDTFATIAAATGVPVTRLQKLNPRVEATSLFIGARLRLR